MEETKKTTTETAVEVATKLNALYEDDGDEGIATRFLNATEYSLETVADLIGDLVDEICLLKSQLSNLRAEAKGPRRLYADETLAVVLVADGAPKNDVPVYLELKRRTGVDSTDFGVFSVVIDNSRTSVSQMTNWTRSTEFSAHLKNVVPARKES